MYEKSGNTRRILNNTGSYNSFLGYPVRLTGRYNTVTNYSDGKVFFFCFVFLPETSNLRTPTRKT